MFVNKWYETPPPPPKGVEIRLNPNETEKLIQILDTVDNHGWSILKGEYEEWRITELKNFGSELCRELIQKAPR